MDQNLERELVSGRDAGQGIFAKMHMMGTKYFVIKKNCPNIGHRHNFKMRQIGGKRSSPNWTRSGIGDK
eukprot:6557293-Ditylum_brightwellii.AAC.1